MVDVPTWWNSTVLRCKRLVLRVKAGWFWCEAGWFWRKSLVALQAVTSKMHLALQALTSFSALEVWLQYGAGKGIVGARARRIGAKWCHGAGGRGHRRVGLSAKPMAGLGGECGCAIVASVLAVGYFGGDRCG
jgi:hypothetical protein